MKKTPRKVKTLKKMLKKEPWTNACPTLEGTARCLKYGTRFSPAGRREEGSWAHTRGRRQESRCMSLPAKKEHWRMGRPRERNSISTRCAKSFDSAKQLSSATTCVSNDRGKNARLIPTQQV